MADEKKKSIPEREEEILAFWNEHKIFEQSLAQRKRGKSFVFYDGPPFATGLPHYGHILASVIKDAIPRFETMRGKYVERTWGWDCHGLPLENLVEQELNLKTKKDIEQYGIEKFNQYAKESVLRYADDWKKIIPRIGRWVDMEDDYRTMDWKYSETVWWMFKTLYDRELIYEGYKSMHICPRCETTLANFEVSQGYKDIKDLSVYVKFELEDEPGTYVLAWTTTPWTLPGNVALAVNPTIAYGRFKLNGISYIAARDLVKELAGKHFIPGLIIKNVSADELIGKKYKPLFDYYSKDLSLKDRESGWKIYPADFVTTDEGTGVVHIAPAFGEEDMEMGKKFNLPFVQHVAMNGTFMPEVKDFAGLPVKPKVDHQVTDKQIISLLESRGLLFAKQEIVHSYPHCWRCDTPLLNYAASSWFVDVTKIKKGLVANNKKISWVPGHIKKGRFGKWLEGARDWAISRSRYWGAPLPVWKCKKCGKVEVIGSLEELKMKQGKSGDIPRNRDGEIDLHRPYIDAVEFSCACGGEMHRVPEVFDCWFESGAMPYGEQHYPFENQKQFDPVKQIGFPADFIAEGIDMTRGWFYSLLVLSTALFKASAYTHVVANGTILAEDGRKMSKRLKNYPDPMDVVNRYGADALRLYLLSSPAVSGEDLNFLLQDLDEVYKKYSLILLNTLNFLLLYRGNKKAKTSGGASKHVLDQWILSRLNQTTAEVTEALERYEIARATRPLLGFVQDLSLWYVRRSRDRVKSDSADGRAALATLECVLIDLARLTAPFTPFLAEMIWQDIGVKTKKSVHLEDWPKADKRLIKKDLEKDMDAVRKIVSEALKLRADAGIKVRQPLNKLQITGPKLRKKPQLLQLIKGEINVKEISFGKGMNLDTTLTKELREEGMVRELVRNIQEMRRDMGLKPKDMIRCQFIGDATIENAVNRLQKQLKKDINAKTIVIGGKKVFKAEREIEIDGKKVWVGVV